MNYWHPRPVIDAVIQEIKDNILGYPWEDAGVECWLKRVVLLPNQNYDNKWAVLLDTTEGTSSNNSCPSINWIGKHGIIVQSTDGPQLVDIYKSSKYPALWPLHLWPGAEIVWMDGS